MDTGRGEPERVLARSVWVLVCRRRTIDATNPTVRHQQRGRCDRARQEAAEPNPPQSVISTAFRFKRNELQHRPGQGHAGHPCPAGDSDTHQRGLEYHHAHDPAVGLAAVVPVGANRAFGAARPRSWRSCHQQASNGWLWSIDQSCVPTMNDKSLGSNMWGGSRTGAGLYERTLGRGRAGQQHLVIGWHAWVWRCTLQHVPDAAFRQLQFWRGIVCR